MTRSRPANVRFYFDADVLGLVKVVVQLRNDCTYPGDPGGTVHKRTRPLCVITEVATPDEEWIAEVARRDWLIVTRDANIQAHRAEITAVRENRARMVALSGKDATTTWAQLEVLMIQWRRVEDLTQQAGPFIYSATRTGGLRRVDLD